jgi:hypothetical protein
MTLSLLLAGLPLVTPSVAVELDALMQEFRATPAVLKPAPAVNLKTVEGKAPAPSVVSL